MKSFARYGLLSCIALLRFFAQRQYLAQRALEHLLETQLIIVRASENKSLFSGTHERRHEVGTSAISVDSLVLKAVGT